MPTLPDAVWLAVAELGRATGLDPLVLDDAGELVLDIGSGLAVHLSAEPEHEALLLTGVPGVLPSPADPVRLIGLMQANFAWRETAGATLSLDGDEPPQVVLARRLPWATLTEQALVEAFHSTSELMLAIHVWLSEPLREAPVGPLMNIPGSWPGLNA